MVTQRLQRSRLRPVSLRPSPDLSLGDLVVRFADPVMVGDPHLVNHHRDLGGPYDLNEVLIEHSSIRHQAEELDGEYALAVAIVGELPRRCLYAASEFSDVAVFR